MTMKLNENDTNLSLILSTIQFDVNIITNHHTLQPILSQIHTINVQLEDNLNPLIEIKTDHQNVLSDCLSSL